MVAGTKRAAVLLAVGLLAMVGDLVGSDLLHGLGLATGASPSPKVFTAREGLEGFSADYTLHWTSGGTAQSLALTPAVYGQLDGPYNRRNVYGAALAGGPFLATHPVLGPLHERVVTYAFCEHDVLTELGAPAADGPITLFVHPRPGTKNDLPLTLELTCPS